MTIQINGTSGISGVDGSAATPALQGSDTNTGISFGTDTVNINTGGTTRATVDSSGRVLVGTSTSRTTWKGDGVNNFVQIEYGGSGYGPGLTLYGNSSTTTRSPILTLGKSGGTTVGSFTLAPANEPIGRIHFEGADGTQSVAAATIEAYVDGTPGAGDMPGRIVLATTADGASSPSERMRIASNGFVGVNINSALAGEKFRVANSGAGANTAAFTFDSSDDRAAVITLHTGSSGATSRKHFEFLDGGGFSRGSISVNGSATAFNTSSDYRLKENIVLISDGIARLQQLRPSRFNFIGNGNPSVDGFIAHEVQTIVPEAVTGEKDAVDDEGNLVYQGIDQSKLVPLLTAALQEAIAKIESLETRLTALEGGTNP